MREAWTRKVVAPYEPTGWAAVEVSEAAVAGDSGVTASSGEPARKTMEGARLSLASSSTYENGAVTSAPALMETLSLAAESVGTMSSEAGH